MFFRSQKTVKCYVRTDPVPVLEVLTDCPEERSLTCLLTSFFRDEQKFLATDLKQFRCYVP